MRCSVGSISNLRPEVTGHSNVGGSLWLLWLALMIPVSALADFGGVYAIKAGHIVTVTGGVIENGTVLIRDGLIEAVGPDIAVPPDAEVIVEDTMYVYPGLIDAHTSLALEKAEQPSSQQARGTQQRPAQPSPTLMSPEMLAADKLNLKDSQIKKFREAGITTVLTVPDNGVFIGQSALISTDGEDASRVVVKSPVAMHLGYSGQRGVYPSSPMGVIAFQCQAFYDAKHHRALWDRYNRYQRGIPRPAPNKSLDAIASVLEGRMRMVISANTEYEMKRAVKLAGEFGFDYVLSGCVEGWRVVDLLRQQGKPVLLSVNYPKPENVTGYSFKLKVDWPKEKPKKDKAKPEKKTGNEAEEKEDAAAEKKEKEDKAKESKKEKDPEIAELHANARVLYEAGVKFAFTSGGMNKPADYLKNVGLAIEQGLPEEEALRALTIYPAEIFGVEEQLGSIEAGKIANLIVANDSLFKEKTKIKYVFVDGKKTELEIKEKKPAGEAKVDVSGTWDLKIESEMGELPATLTLKQSESEVTGQFKSEMGSAEITEGSVSGNSISLTITLSMGGQSFVLTMQGTVEGDSMEGSIDFGEMGSADWTATKSSGPGMMSRD